MLAPAKRMLEKGRALPIKLADKNDASLAFPISRNLRRMGLSDVRTAGVFNERLVLLLFDSRFSLRIILFFGLFESDFEALLRFIV